MRKALLFGLSAFILGCTAEAASDRRIGVDQLAVLPTGTSSPSFSAPALLARTTGDELALVDGATGAVRSAVPLGDGGGPRDFDVGDEGSRAFAFIGDPDDPFGEIVSMPIDGETLGEAQHVTWFDGLLRLASTPEGLLVFLRGYANQWKLLPNDGAFLPSVTGVSPLSVVRTEGAYAVLAPRADGGLKLRTIGDEAWPPPPARLLGVDAATETPSARLVRARGGRLWLVDHAGDDVGIRQVKADRLGPVHLLGSEPGGRLEEAVAYDGGRRIAALFSGSNRLLTFRIDVQGMPSEIAVLELPGPVRRDELGPSRRIAALSPRRLAIGTEGGVVVVELAGAEPTIDETFSGSALRAPLVVLPPKPE